MESLQSQRTGKHQLILQMDAKKKLINVPKNDKKVVIASNSGVFILSEAKSKSISNYHHRLFQVMHFNNNKTKCNEIKFSDLLLTPRIINCIHSSFFGRSCEIFETVITYSKLKQQYHFYALAALEDHLLQKIVFLNIDYSKGKLCGELIDFQFVTGLIDGCQISAISQKNNELHAFALDENTHNMYHAVYQENKFVVISTLRYEDFAYGNTMNVLSFRFVPNNLNILSLLAIPDLSYTSHIGMKLFMYNNKNKGWNSKLLDEIPQKLSDASKCCQIKGNGTNILIYFDTYYRLYSDGNVLIYDLNANKFIFTNISFVSVVTNTVKISIIKRDELSQQLFISGWCRNNIQNKYSNVTWPMMLTRIVSLFHDEEYIHIINDNPYSKYYMCDWKILVDTFFAYL